MNKLDILIPCGPNDVSFVQKVVLQLRKFIVGADIIYIVSNDKYLEKIRKTIKDEKTIVLDENTIVDGLDFSIVKTFMNKQMRYEGYGWIFQQLLKIGFSTTSYAKEYYLSWDADTLPLQQIDFFEGGQPNFTIKTEYHKPYFETNERLIGIGKTQPYSFIAEHMVFKTEYVRNLLIAIDQSPVKGSIWVEKILNACEFTTTEVFSEFELYGSFVTKNYPESYKTRQLRSFRNGGMIRGRHISDRLLDQLAFDLDIASFEYKSEAPFPYNLDGWLWRRFRRFSKWKNMPLTEIPGQLYESLKRRMRGKQ